MSDCCLTPNEQFFSYFMVRTSYFWDDDKVHFVLDQHDLLDFNSAFLKQQPMDRHVAPLGHIIPMPSQPVFTIQAR